MPSPDKYSGYDAYIGSDAMNAYIKGLAARLPAGGRVKSRLSQNVWRGLSRMPVSEDVPAIIQDNIKWITLLARGLSHERRVRLPASLGKTRIGIVAGELISHSDFLVTRESLYSAIESFDEVQGLSMDEIWLFPREVTMALTQAFYSVSRFCVSFAGEAESAREWADGDLDMDGLKNRGCAFYEQALKSLGEQGRDEDVRKVVNWLDERDGASRVLLRARDARSRNMTYLRNIVTSLRCVQDINWKSDYEALCRAERILLEDAVYSRSDDESRKAVRREVARVSRLTGLGEWTVARHAAQMAANSRVSPMNTCVYWLYDADGLNELKRRLSAFEDARVRVSAGNVYIACFIAIFALIMCISLNIIGWWAIPTVFILSWRYAKSVLDFIITKTTLPRILLKLKLNVVPDEYRTLVVVPALLSSVDRARELVSQLAALGAATSSDSIGYLLLGDFKDSPEEESDDDESIVAFVREAVDELNRDSGKKRFFYLHRRREYVKADNRYMARERKRGALMELNALLIGLDAKFAASPDDMDALRYKFKYVLTLDADARILPEDQRALIGAIAHPLNRRRTENGVKKGYSVISPRVEQTSRTRFSRLFAFPGGLDSYPISISSAYWDMCANAAFCGKGIYDVRDFYYSLKGVLPDYAILSHDLVEGALSGAGLASDCVVLDDFPKTPQGYLKRLHRWTRGDWQLLPYIFALPLNGLSRFMMLDNLVGSLEGAARVISLIASSILGYWPLFIFALIEPAREALHQPSRGLMRLALLPETAYRSVDAAVRAIYRTYNSKRGLLDWTPAADCDGGQDDFRAGKICALAVLPGLFQGAFAPFAVGLGLIFWVGGAWASRGEKTFNASREDKEALMALARSTWDYFEDTVPLLGNGLVPDNIQIDPPALPAQRTSPTNIAMYVLSCLSACALGIISRENAEARIEKTMSTMEKMPRWKGQLYNWYDTKTGLPMKPEYVSSVDGGNLAASLMLAANFLSNPLGDRCEAFAREMELESLYDEERELFYIGYDVGEDRLSDSHYDLLASESRILSFASIALGKVGQEHWNKLGRRMNGKTLMSWSGTMFEYLMPELFTHSSPGTLLGQSEISLVKSRPGEQMGVWGVSESGFYAFDSRLNFQYRAFGVARVSLRGGGDGKVIAPYATALALPVDPQASLENLRKIVKNGWTGKYGLYEAVDFDPDRLMPGEKYKVVKSYMTHHQGMILSSIANFLTDGAIRRAFSDRADVRAYEPLLEQRPMRAPREIVAQFARVKPAGVYKTAKRVARQPFDAHLLEGGSTSVVALADGLSISRRGEIDIDRFSRIGSPNDGTHTLVSVNGKQCAWTRGVFSPGEAAWSSSAQGVAFEMRLTVSGEDGATYRIVEFENVSKEKKSVCVINAFAVALCEGGNYLSHPAFMNMFVTSVSPYAHRAVFTRNGREKGVYPKLVCDCSGSKGVTISLENDLWRLLGRRGGFNDFDAYEKEFTFTEGYTLNQCLAQKAEVELNAGEKGFAVFRAALYDDDDSVETVWSAADMAKCAARAGELARARLEILSIDISQYIKFDKDCLSLFYPRLKAYTREYSRVCKNDLWSMGLDVTHPIIAAFASNEDELRYARDASDRCMFYGAMGVKCALALVCDEPRGYSRPVYDALSGIAASCIATHVKVIDGASITRQSREALYKSAAIIENNPSREPVVPNKTKCAAPDWKFGKAELMRSSGFGGFSSDGKRYIINSVADFPAPWVNVLANEHFGAMITERAGGFAWSGNSRLGRITPWTGDAMYEGYIFRLSLALPDGTGICLVPSTPPATASHTRGESRFQSSALGLQWSIVFEVSENEPVLRARVRITNTKAETARLKITLEGNFLMGADASDARLLSFTSSDGFICASGDMPVLGFLYLNGATYSNGILEKSITASNGSQEEFDVFLGCASDEAEAREKVAAEFKCISEYWDSALSRLTVDTPDTMLNAFINNWLPYQTISSRIFARAGFYQAGGAFGFRDQLQDMLLMISIDPKYVRAHILYCAARQFEDGDAMHWWHPPATGVRTRISDDCVFLAYVTSKYVVATGDNSILEENVPYLKNAPIEEGKDDAYICASRSDSQGTLHEHCMSAIRRSSRTGANRLAFMGGGDWNDGMNRVGGESVWLSEFLIATCTCYSEILGSSREGDAAELQGIANGLKSAVEEHGWNTKWYSRASYPDGEFIGREGAKECEIDLIAQSWAVLAGLDPERSKRSMDEAWNRLVRDGIIKLLTPPFTSNSQRYPGYIADYPPGVRENGGQYTHGACWAVMAWAKLGQAERAWKAFEMLLPYNHASSKKESRRYRAEPYVLAADVYSSNGYAGRGGWTWYTGAAGWMYVCAIYGLLGFEKRGDRARLNALLPEKWNTASISIKIGKSTYKLTAKRSATCATADLTPVADGWIDLIDDGRDHEAVFPVRETHD